MKLEEDFLTARMDYNNTFFFQMKNEVSRCWLKSCFHCCWVSRIGLCQHLGRVDALVHMCMFLTCLIVRLRTWLNRLSGKSSIVSKIMKDDTKVLCMPGCYPLQNCLLYIQKSKQKTFHLVQTKVPQTLKWGSQWWDEICLICRRFFLRNDGVKSRRKSFPTC